MFRARPTASEKTFRLAIMALLAFSVAALAITAWVMVDFLKEQQIVQELLETLPPASAVQAETLVGELRWQFRLSALVVLNLVVTAFAVVLLWRAYRTSQESLRDVRALAADILSIMDQVVITTDLAGLVTSINQRGLDLLDVTHAHVGRPLEELSATLPLEEMRQDSTANRSQPSTNDFHVPANGAAYTLRAFCQPLRNHDGLEIGHVLQLRDVTERVLIEERMLRMERYMGLGSLAAGLHHEIKNPLAALSLHVQLLEEQLDRPSTSGEVNEMLKVIRTEVTRVGGVLENFRDSASLEQLNTVSLAVGALVDRQAKLIAPRAESLNIRVKVDLPASPLPKLIADPVRLEQVILNLLVNAMDAMPDGGCLTVCVSKEKHSESIEIQVVDTGGGIPESVRENVFDPYFTTKNGGTGMGLALCDKIIRQHNGAMECRTSEEGATFVITVPLEPVDHFLSHFCHRHRRSEKSIATDAMHLLTSARWPGNVRQLRNVIERLVVTLTDDIITVAALPVEFRTEPSSEPSATCTLAEATEAAEKDAIQTALAYCDFHRERAAKTLGISVRTLHYKMSRYGLH